MMKNILKSLFVAVALVFGVNAYADNITATLVHTASSYCETDPSAYVSTVDSEKEHVNNSKFSGAWQGAAYADFSIVLPEGHSIKSASLAWSGIGSSKDRTTDIMYVNAGEQLDYEAFAAGNAKVNLPATKIATVTFKKSATTDFTTDVTDAVKAITGAGQGNVIFKFTNNTGAGDLVGKGATEKAPVLTIETVSADAMTTYTVVAVDGSNNTLKSTTYDAVIGSIVTASAEDMAAFKNEDSSKKYIYVGGNTEITTVKEAASNVITLVFREAEKWTYTVNAVDGEGNVLSELVSSSDFEGESVTASYNQYILKDSVLYSAAANNKEYNVTFALTSNEFIKEITYSASSINNVVFFSEAEDIWGMTKTTSGNANIRCSNAAGAFNGEDSEVSIVTLTPGVYTIAAQVWGNAGTDLKVACGKDTLVVATAGYILSGNKSFTVRKETEVTIPALTGNENRCIDWIYIQKTGIVPPTEVANIAALKDVEEGIEVKLALTDAVVNAWSGAGLAAVTYVEDATGAIKFDMGLSNMEWMNDSIKMNGYIYAQYGKDYDGIPQLSVSDSTGASKVDTVAAVPASKVMTVADASTESALSRYVKFENVVFAKKAIDEWTTDYCLVQGTDTIVFFDKFTLFGWGAMPDFKSFDEVQGFISMYDGKFEFYPFGEYKANYTPAVVVENIAAAKAVESGTNVNLTLKDAKVTAYVASRWGAATAYIEDASGAIQISGDALSAIGVENDSTILNGNIYVKYVNEWGAIQLNPGDSIAYSKVEAKEGAVSPTTMAVKDINDSANVARYVEVTFPSFKYDAENYCYLAVQNGDTIKVVDNFGWMSSNYEMDEEYNLILPDSVSSIRGIVMWDDWNGYSIAPTGIDEFVAPQDIVVNVTEGDIAAAVEAAKAEVAKVGKITINLTEGAAYTIANSIVAPAGVVINGNGATVDATALAGAIVSLNGTETQALNQDGTENAKYKMIDSVAINNVVVKSLVHPIVKDAQKTLVGKLVVDNSVIEISGSYNVFDFASKGYPTELSVNNSTIWSKDGHEGYLLQAGGRVRDLDPNQTEYKQIISIANSTLHKISVGKQFNNLSGKGQKSLVLSMTSTITSDCTVNGNEVRGWLGGQNSNNPSVTYDKNTYWAEGAVQAGWTNGSQGSDATGTSLTTNPGFKDAANGDFTVGAGSDQAKEKIGDPRWLVEYDNTATAIEGVNATIMNNGDIYTINGVKVRNAGDSLKGLAKGLYIINGKKLIVK